MRPERHPLLDDVKLLVLSWAFPPMPIGTAFVAGALLSSFEPDEVIVFTGDPGNGVDRSDVLDVRRYDLPRWWPQDVIVRIGRLQVRLRLRAVGNVAVGLRVAAAAVRLLRRDDVKGVLAVYPKQHFLLAGLLAAAIARKPLLVFYMDVYVEGLPRGRKVARMIDRYVARRAAVAFVLNAPQRERLLETWAGYGRRDIRVLEVPVPYAVRTEDLPARSELPGRPSIAFTGTIYEAQAEAIRRLVESLSSGELDGLEPHLHLVTQSSPEALARLGIVERDRIHVRSASPADVRASQRGSDILYLPLSFDAAGAVLETTSPSKLPEYLASGQPILVHAPASSFLVAYAEQYGFAEVVAEPSPDALARAVRRLATDEERRREVVDRAARTLERHLLDNVAKVFRKGVEAALEER